MAAGTPRPRRAPCTHTHTQTRTWMGDKHTKTHTYTWVQYVHTHTQPVWLQTTRNGKSTHILQYSSMMQTFFEKVFSQIEPFQSFLKNVFWKLFWTFRNERFNHKYFLYSFFHTQQDRKVYFSFLTSFSYCLLPCSIVALYMFVVRDSQEMIKGTQWEEIILIRLQIKTKSNEPR